MSDFSHKVDMAAAKALSTRNCMNEVDRDKAKLNSLTSINPEVLEQFFHVKLKRDIDGKVLREPYTYEISGYNGRNDFDLHGLIGGYIAKRRTQCLER